MLKSYLSVGYKLVIMQFIFTSIAAAIYIFIGNWYDFTSVLFGGSAWIIPSLCFIYKLFKSKDNKNSQVLMRNFIIGEMAKLLLSAVLIIIITIFFHTKTVSFLSGYIAAISASFFMPFCAPCYIKNKNDK